MAIEKPVTMLEKVENFTAKVLTWVDTKIFFKPPPKPMPSICDLLPEIKPWCAVCKEKFELDSAVKQIPCKHCYHLECLREWMENNDSCPMCSAKLPKPITFRAIWKAVEEETRWLGQ
ncbi:E3 ubiquitin-protein ligase RZF1-like [Selaginella moellendorffii]|uniref:E3 ubiquitin-protein ligase RZF1-like n=1 Tax=Selaginella moellendorffii TaxID=88036 RepID=UPI000D1C79C1|nr:E3 ubiquitin-protein ligase RZF1-like [Selaginella moellendorffii]|eukprot:XP_024540733.1 E3 ubiquitin-protein ligase RZF1-like [Selaginella moellendorffii]